jgi:hypothetical protein
MTLGLVAEYERWHLAAVPRKAWSLFAGLAWGLACWTSLFEPVVAVIVLAVFNLIVRRRESFVFGVSFGVVLLVALILEGVHIYIPPPEYHDALKNWLETIAEVLPLDFSTFMQQMTLGVLLLPFAAWPLWRRENASRTDRFLILLTAIFMLFTIYQRRWIYYANLGELFLLVRFFQLSPKHWARVLFLLIFLAGLFDAGRQRLAEAQKAGPNQPSLQLLQISNAIDAPGAILGPWWLSPGLLYFSGHPIVTGSSHCGISGIVSGAEFYTATSWSDAERILKARQVQWVVVSDDPNFEYPLLNISRRILGLPVFTDEDSQEAAQSVAQILITDRYVPTWLQLRAVTSQLKLYKYTPSGN